MTASPPEAYRGTLYLVGTPIGNLEDITLRALRILREVTVIAAEDTRQTRKLLDRHSIRQQLISYFEHNEKSRVEPILERLRTGDVALVSDAGMPGLSDPGYDLVRAAIAVGISVVPIPGPSAPITALAASGLPTDQFVYVGFLPRRSAERKRLLSEVSRESRTVVAFESPQRLIAALEDIRSELGDREVVIARELTKIHEEFIRGTVTSSLERFRKAAPRGEITLLIRGSPDAAPVLDAPRRIQQLLDDGRAASDIATTVAAETGLPRRQIYRLLLGMKNHVKI